MSITQNFKIEPEVVEPEAFDELILEMLNDDFSKIDGDETETLSEEELSLYFNDLNLKESLSSIIK